jgi:hypothetical protein
LVDFPSTFAQAKLLEKALSGYEPSEDLEPTERQQLLTDAEMLVKPNPKPQPPKTLIKSGLDAVIWFNCEIKECIRRADGRRVDEKQQDTMFHVEDKMPPTDQAPLCERLRHLDNDQNSTGSLIDRYVAFDQATSSLQVWLTQFGVESEQRNLMQTIDAVQTVSNVHYAISQIAESVVSFKTRMIETTREALVAHFTQVFETKALQAKEEAEKASLEEPSKTTTNLSVNPSPDKKEHHSVSKSSLIPDPAPLSPEQIRERIDNDFKPVIISLWTQLSSNYKKQMKKIFKNFRLMREQVLNRRSDTQQRFLTFLHNVDAKQAILDEFVAKFN